MASLLILLDDIAATLDDVAVMSKIAAKKTAGVLGDDLALNAEQVQGVASARELPVVWAVAKGSFVNKLILVPLALALSAWLPSLITPLLMLGGLYLCYEGAEKVYHLISHRHAPTAIDNVQDDIDQRDTQTLSAPQLATLEREKIKGAVRTDFILSAEIVVISLGVMADKPFATQAISLSLIAILMTVFVYGLVALIVKLDDVGFWLQKTNARKLGDTILYLAPKLMRLLSALGTVAMFLVGGGIIVHGAGQWWHGLHHVSERVSHILFGESLLGGAIGALCGALLLGVVMAVQKMRGK